ncbi:unnamed protein product [Moneuplotes crassus]|uniref:Uncharacterized protein n=1 Tax=Euplotes crassus TaxID=5936 RepID=A0AAD1Y7U5_EUPCR|nr:unnamed protein product [Moneuplotes crassus]
MIPRGYKKSHKKNSLTRLFNEESKNMDEVLNNCDMMFQMFSVPSSPHPNTRIQVTSDISTSKFGKGSEYLMNKHKSRVICHSKKNSHNHQPLGDQKDVLELKKNLFGTSTKDTRKKKAKKSRIMSIVDEYTSKTSALKKSFQSNWYRKEKGTEYIEDDDCSVDSYRNPKRKNFDKNSLLFNEEKDSDYTFSERSTKHYPLRSRKNDRNFSSYCKNERKNSFNFSKKPKMYKEIRLEKPSSFSSFCQEQKPAGRREKYDSNNYCDMGQRDQGYITHRSRKQEPHSMYQSIEQNSQYSHRERSRRGTSSRSPYAGLSSRSKPRSRLSQDTAPESITDKEKYFSIEMLENVITEMKKKDKEETESPVNPQNDKNVSKELDKSGLTSSESSILCESSSIIKELDLLQKDLPDDLKSKNPQLLLDQILSPIKEMESFDTRHLDQSLHKSILASSKNSPNRVLERKNPGVNKHIEQEKSSSGGLSEFYFTNKLPPKSPNDSETCNHVNISMLESGETLPNKPEAGKENLYAIKRIKKRGSLLEKENKEHKTHSYCTELSTKKKEDKISNSRYWNSLFANNKTILKKKSLAKQSSKFRDFDEEKRRNRLLLQPVYETSSDHTRSYGLSEQQNASNISNKRISYPLRSFRGIGYNL